MLGRVKSYFQFEELGASMRTEVVGGVTTFMTMAYIIFVNPGILSNTGMDFNAVMMATCLAAALGTTVMALVARYPIALAPGMGMNAFFAFEIVLGFGVPWPTALGMVFISGLLFLLLTVLHVREMLINAIPESLKLSIAAGIGLFIAFIGFQHAGLVVKNPVTLVELGDLTSKTTLISLAALAATVVMLAAGIRGAVLWGIILAGVMGLVFGAIEIPPGVPKDVVGPAVGALAGVEHFHVVSLPPSISPTAFKLDIPDVFTSVKWIALCLVLLFFDLFDTLGTLIGVCQQAGFLDKEGRLPRANHALFADAVATVAGALLGTSTTTSYIESATGVSAGARTGMAGLVVALLFLLATFFAPVVELFAKPFVTAPALIVVGCLMMTAVSRIPWERMEEAIPAFLVLTVMPLTFSISRGMVAGLVSWPLLKLAAGKGREVHWLLYLLAGLLLAGVVANYLVL